MLTPTLRMDRSLTHRLIRCCSNKLAIHSTTTIIKPADKVPSTKLSKLTCDLPSVRLTESSSSRTTGNKPKLCKTATPHTTQENTRSIKRIVVDCGKLALNTRATNRMMVSENSSDTAKRSQNTGMY